MVSAISRSEAVRTLQNLKTIEDEILEGEFRLARPKRVFRDMSEFKAFKRETEDAFIPKLGIIPRILHYLNRKLEGLLDRQIKK